MRIGGIEVKRRSWISLLFASTVIVLWWLWTGSKIPVPATQPVPALPAVRIATTEIGKNDDLLHERAEYFDPTPLFFPTKWNFGQGNLRDSVKRQPGQIFDFLEPKFIFGDQNIKSYSVQPVTESSNLADVVLSGNEVAFAGLGEEDTKSPGLADRGGFVEIISLREGKTIVAQALEEIPGVHSDFPPLEFLVAVSSSGLVGDPVLMRHSCANDTPL